VSLTGSENPPGHGGDETLRRRTRRTSSRAVAFAVAALGIAGTTFAVASSLTSNAPSHAIATRLPDLVREGVDHPYVRAFGLDPSAAKQVISTADGVSLTVVRDPDAACVMASDGDDQCFDASQVAIGRGYEITNDCARVHGAMRLMGVAPQGTTAVLIQYNSGPGRSTQTHDGVFYLDARTPAPGEAFPTEVQYVTSSGGVVATDKVPGGDSLCPPDAN
jgi:hypothetical protein